MDWLTPVIQWVLPAVIASAATLTVGIFGYRKLQAEAAKLRADARAVEKSSDSDSALKVAQAAAQVAMDSRTDVDRLTKRLEYSEKLNIELNRQLAATQMQLATTQELVASQQKELNEMRPRLRSSESEVAHLRDYVELLKQKLRTLGHDVPEPERRYSDTGPLTRKGAPTLGGSSI